MQDRQISEPSCSERLRLAHQRKYPHSESSNIFLEENPTTDVQQASNNQFKMTQDGMYHYMWIGDYDQFYNGNYNYITFNTGDLVKKFLERHDSEVNILDIGCGFGAVVKKFNNTWPSRARAIGITAESKHIINNPNIYLADAHDLMRCSAVLPQKFHFFTNVFYAS